MAEQVPSNVLPDDRGDSPQSPSQEALNEEPVERPDRPTTINDRQRRKAQHQLEESTPSFPEAFMMGREMDAVGPAIVDELSRDNPENDPDFEMTKERWDNLTKDIPVEDQDIFSGVASEEEAEKIRERYLKEREMEQDIAKAGWTGLGARLLAGVFDETALSAAVASEGAATPWILSAKATRLSRAVRASTVAGATEASFENFVSTQRETKDSSDVLFAGLMGAALGAPFGAFARPVSSGSGPSPQPITGYANDAERFHRAAQAQNEEDFKDVVQSVTEMDRPEVDQFMTDLRNNKQAWREAKKELDEARAQQRRAETEYPERRVLRDLGDEAGNRTDLENQLSARIDEADGDSSSMASRADSRVPEPEGRQELQNRVVNALTPKRKNGIGKKEAFKIRARADERIKEAEREAGFEAAEASRRVSELESRVNELEGLIQGQADSLNAARRSTRSTALGEDSPGESVLMGTARDQADNQPLARGDTGARADGSDRSAGAAETEGIMPQTPNSGPPINTERVPEAAEQRAEVPFQKARFDLYSRVAKSESNTMNLLARDILSDPLGGDSGRRVVGEGQQQVRSQAAAEAKDQLAMGLSVKFYKRALPAWDSWAREQGLNWLKRAWGGKERNEFFERVTHAVRTGEADNEYVEQAADAIRESNREILQLAKEARLAGFEDVEESMKYIHRHWDGNKFKRLEQDETVGEVGIKRLLARSIMDGDENRETPQEVADSIANAIYRRFMMQGYGIQPEFNSKIFSRDVGEIRSVLKESGLEESEIQRVVRHLEANEADAGKAGGQVNFAKNRIQMDENASVYLPESGRTVHFSELVENNAEFLHKTYLNKMSGHISIARKFRDQLDEEEVNQFGVRTDTVMERLIYTARTEGATEREVNNLKIGYNLITGRPPENDVDSTLHRVMRFVRDWNFVRLMGQVGFAQIAEFGPILGQVGVVNALRNIPKFRSIVKRARNGDIDEPMLREMEEFNVVFGAERMVMQPQVKMEDWGPETPTSGKFLDQAEQVMERVKRATADVSGMSGVTIYMQRLAGLSAGHRLLKLAKQGQLDNARMKSLGIDSEMAERIQRQLVDKSGKVEMESGRYADVMNLKDWDDAEAREVLLSAMHRWGSRMVQRNLVGELPGFMHTLVGNMMGQFRSFMLTAYSKQLLQGVNMKDFQTFMTFAFSTMFAGASYTAQQSLNSLGQDDPEKFREERLSAANIGLSAFQRAGFASLLPGAIDTVAPMMPMLDEGIFQYGRSSGLATDFVSGNPSVDLVDSAYRGAKAAIAAPMRSDRDFAKSDFRDLWGVMALNNTTGIRNIGNLLEQQLPERTTRGNARSIEDLMGIDEAR